MESLTTVHTLEGHHEALVHDALYFPRHRAVISVSDDKTLKCWLQRDEGSYWPSVSQELPGAATALACNVEGDKRHVFVGLETGLLLHYECSADFNSMTLKKSAQIHTARIVQILLDPERDLILTCSRDKDLRIHSMTSFQLLSAYQTEAWCTCLQYDHASANVFVGTLKGEVHVLKIESNRLVFIVTLKEHTGSILSLLWDSTSKILYSGSHDRRVLAWDIGGCKGTFYDLCGHRGKVLGLVYVTERKLLVSFGDDRRVVVWDMAAARKPTPDWNESDVCQLCGACFFWNLKGMWEKKEFGLNRQHHCRRCGKAVCHDCSLRSSTYPVMGLEFPVRMCSACFSETTDSDRKPLARAFVTKHCVVSVHLQAGTTQIVTTNRDGSIRVLDMGKMLASSGSTLAAEPVGTLTDDDDNDRAATEKAAAAGSGGGRGGGGSGAPAAAAGSGKAGAEDDDEDDFNPFK
eukprot:m.60699 g.60699  ORF g.60699 m.60699 type:complete len:463 (-) comp16114_c0_seq2:53-1441(-)